MNGGGGKGNDGDEVVLLGCGLLGEGNDYEEVVEYY